MYVWRQPYYCSLQSFSIQHYLLNVSNGILFKKSQMVNCSLCIIKSIFYPWPTVLNFFLQTGMMNVIMYLHLHHGKWPSRNVNQRRQLMRKCFDKLLSCECLLEFKPGFQRINWLIKQFRFGWASFLDYQQVVHQLAEQISKENNVQQEAFCLRHNLSKVGTPPCKVGTPPPSKIGTQSPSIQGR